MTVIYAEYDSPLGVRYRTELHQAGFGGTAREVSANGNFHDHNYQSLNEREPHKTPLLDSDFTFYFRAETEADKTLLENVFASDYGDYQIVKKVNGSEVWRGNVQTDRVQYREAAFPFSAQIKARDIEILKGKDFPLVTDEDRVPLIEVFAEILSEAIDIPIYAYTTWKEGSMTLTQDFLAEREIDRFALKTYARVGGEEDEPITMYDALNGLCRNFGFILFQSGGVWRLWQITALADPTSVREFRYSSAGVATGSSLVNLTTAIDGDLFLLNRSLNTGVKSYRSAGARYDHRTIVSGLKLPRGITITGSGSEAYSAFFSSSGDQVINLSGRVTALDDTDNSAGEADIKVRVGQYYFDGNVWTTDVNDRVTIPMTGGGFLIDGEYQYTGFISISTPPVPSDATSPIEIEFFNAEIIPDGGGGNIVPNSTGWSPILEVDNPVVPDESSTAIDFLLTQTKLESSRYDHGALLFGDGPSGNSRGAISRPDGSLTNAQWRRLSDSNRDFYEVLLKEIMDVQRSSSRLISAQLWGGYEPHQIISYQGENYFFIGGNQTGKNRWNARLFQINIQSAVTDTFATLLKFTADGSTGSATPIGTPTGGISQSFADGRYNRRSLNGEDFADIPTVRDNLSVYSRAELDATQLQNDIDLVQLGLQDDALFLQKADKGIQVTLNPSGGLEGGGTNDLSADSEFGVSIADSGVTTAKIDNGAVTNDKLATDSVSTIKILDANVTNAKLANSTISGKALGTNLDSLSAGNGLTGTAYNGSAPQTFAVGTPSTTTVGGSNGVTATSHTHALDLSGRTLTAGDGLTGLGDLGADRTVNLGTPSTLTVSSTNSTTATSHNHALDLSGRTLTIANDADSVITFPTNAQNLGANRTWTPTVADAGVSQRGVVSIGAQTFAGNKTFDDDILLDGKFQNKGSFTSGFSGSGFRLQKDSSVWGMELDDVFIRGALFASEFIINQISALNGSDFLSPAVGKVEVVAGTPPAEVLTMSDPQGNDITGFKANDIVIVQQVTPQAYDGEAGQIVKRIVREVDSVTNNVVTLKSLSGAPTASGTIEVGDIMVALGNTDGATNPNRQAHIYRSVIDSGAPFVRINENVNSWASFGDAEKLMLQYGKLSGLTIDGTTLTGNGLYTANAFLTGSLVVGDLGKTDNYLEYDSGVLSVDGTVVIRGGSGIGNLTDAGALALLDSVTGANIDDATIESAKLGTTVISGGLIVTSLLSADNIQTGTLTSQTNNTTFNLDTGQFDADVFKLSTPTIVVNSTTPKIALGATADSITVDGNEVGFIVDGAGNFKLYHDDNNYIRKGTDNKLDIKADEVSIGAVGDLAEAVLDIRTDLVQLGLEAGGAYSGIQFLAGQTIISASSIDGGRAKLATVRLDATGVESLVGIEADNFLLETNGLTIDSDEFIRLGQNFATNGGVLISTAGTLFSGIPNNSIYLQASDTTSGRPRRLLVKSDADNYFQYFTDNTGWNFTLEQEGVQVMRFDSDDNAIIRGISGNIELNLEDDLLNLKSGGNTFGTLGDNGLQFSTLSGGWGSNQSIRWGALGSEVARIGIASGGMILGGDRLEMQVKKDGIPTVAFQIVDNEVRIGSEVEDDQYLPVFTTQDDDGYTIGSQTEYMIIKFNGVQRAIPLHTATPPSPPPSPPGAPTSPSICRDSSPNGIRVKWTNSTTGGDVDDYQVFRSESSGSGFILIGSAGSGATGFLDSEAEFFPTTTYYYKVRATNSGGNSAFTSEVSGTYNGISAC